MRLYNNGFEAGMQTGCPKDMQQGQYRKNRALAF